MGHGARASPDTDARALRLPALSDSAPGERLSTWERKCHFRFDRFEVRRLVIYGDLILPITIQILRLYQRASRAQPADVRRRRGAHHITTHYDGHCALRRTPGHGDKPVDQANEVRRLDRYLPVGHGVASC